MRQCFMQLDKVIKGLAQRGNILVLREDRAWRWANRLQKSAMASSDRGKVRHHHISWSKDLGAGRNVPLRIRCPSPADPSRPIPGLIPDIWIVESHAGWKQERLVSMDGSLEHLVAPNAESVNIGWQIRVIGLNLHSGQDESVRPPEFLA